jgi:hypothetical protein
MTDLAKKTVTITIDKKDYISPNPTTGSALYVLANISTRFDLFQEVKEGVEDHFIPKDNTPIVLQAGDRFYPAQTSFNV